MATLFTIGYSHAKYDADFVKRIFDDIFGGVENVEEKLFSPQGRPKYKKFFIRIRNHLNSALAEFNNIITAKKFAAIIYANEWDYKVNGYVDRYWKVFATHVFQPRVMSMDQMMRDVFLVNTVDPWSAAADKAFEPETTPPPHPLFGSPCKLVRSEPKEFTELKEEFEMDDFESADFCTPPPFYRCNT
jgi:hypothetical protein